MSALTPAVSLQASLPPRPTVDSDLLSDETLMLRYAAGDTRACETLVQRHRPALLRAIRRRVGNDEDAHDLLQHTLLNLHRARGAFDPAARLRPWLYAIALNAVRQHCRKLQRRREAPLDAPEAGQRAVDPARPVDDMILAQSVRAALAVLLDNQREVIEMRWFEGRSYEEIARHVGASPAAVRVRAHRGYERLRSALGTQA